MIVNEDRFFLSHRKEIALAAQRADRGVTKDVPAWTIAAGVPARVVRNTEIIT